MWHSRVVPLVGSRSRLALVVALGLASEGCSFFFVKGPPAGHETMEHFSCTESRTLPVLDAVWVGLNLITLATAESDWFMSKDQKIRSGIFWVAVSGTSSAVGFTKVDKCRAALAREIPRAAQQERLRVRGDPKKGEGGQVEKTGRGGQWP